MAKQFSRVLTQSSLMALAFAAAMPAHAQDAGAGDQIDSNEIIVQARRKDESIQDVPLTVNAVTNEELQNLNLRRFEDIAAVMPGLTLNGVNSSVRGVAFNQVLSGSSSTIGFYLNDGPVPATNLQQALYDIGQVELLRGPQGTLRGRATPSGSMTLTTRRPDMNEWGGYVSGTGTEFGQINFNGAVGGPIVPGILAVRLAGLYDDGPGSNVRSLSGGVNPNARIKSWRATVQFDPVEALQLIFTAQHYRATTRSYQILEDNRVATPATLQPGRTFITGQDRRSLQDTASIGETWNRAYNLQARFSFAGQRLNYVGQRTLTGGIVPPGLAVTDTTDYYGPTQPGVLQGFGSVTDTQVRTWSHEVRLSNEERIADFLDYTIGYFRYQSVSPTLSTSFRPANPTFYTGTSNAVPGTPTLGASALVVPGTTYLSQTIIDRRNVENEESFFGNLTVHLGDATEFSGGIRHISYNKVASTGITSVGRRFYVGSGSTVEVATPSSQPNQNESYSAWIWSGSAKHNFSDDVMLYATVGRSWRPGTTVVGVEGNDNPARILQFSRLQPETSTSYEIGAKTSLLDKRMTFNVSAFYQKFSNFPYSAARATFATYNTVSGVTTPTINTNLGVNLAAVVPATVYGGELEWSFRPNDKLSLSAGVSYAHSRINNGTIPCNDYILPDGVTVGSDGIPDTFTGTYTAAQINTATGGQGVGACKVTGVPASITPEWSGFAQGEYRQPVSDHTDVFLRGLLNWYGSNKNDYANPIDDVAGYALLNLYLGARDNSGRWEISAYAKNITNTFRVTSRSQTSIAVPGVSTGIAYTGYRTITVTDPREFGVTMRFAFGSR
jgi:iron complex outermembrane recepter protein